MDSLQTWRIRMASFVISVLMTEVGESDSKICDNFIIMHLPNCEKFTIFFQKIHTLNSILTNSEKKSSEKYCESFTKRQVLF